MRCETRQEVIINNIKVYDSECSMFTSCFCCDSGEGPICGISRYDEAILTAVQSGEIKQWKFNDKERLIIDAGPNLCRMRHSYVNKNIIATGGKENKLKLFDLEKQAQTFIEKNLPHDWLQLKVPIWISELCFLPNSDKVVTSDKYGNVRLYDPKAQRKPVINFLLEDEALITMAVCHRDKQVVVGSGKGVMKLIDLRNTGHAVHTYKGFCGGITGIACSSTKPYIVSTSLDRHLLVHDMDTTALLRKEYLVSRLTGLVIRSEFSINDTDSSFNENSNCGAADVSENSGPKNGQKDDSKADAGSDAEYDALFDKMAVVTNKTDQKRKIEADDDKPAADPSVAVEKGHRKRKRKCKKSKTNSGDT